MRRPWHAHAFLFHPLPSFPPPRFPLSVNRRVYDFTFHHSTVISTGVSKYPPDLWTDSVHKTYLSHSLAAFLWLLCAHLAPHHHLLLRPLPSSLLCAQHLHLRCVRFRFDYLRSATICDLYTGDRRHIFRILAFAYRHTAAAISCQCTIKKIPLATPLVRALTQEFLLGDGSISPVPFIFWSLFSSSLRKACKCTNVAYFSRLSNWQLTTGMHSVQQACVGYLIHHMNVSSSYSIAASHVIPPLS